MGNRFFMLLVVTFCFASSIETALAFPLTGETRTVEVETQDADDVKAEGGGELLSAALLVLAFSIIGVLMKAAKNQFTKEVGNIMLLLAVVMLILMLSICLVRNW